MAHCRVLVAVQEVTRFVVECMMKVGASNATACTVADVLVTADALGHYSHGSKNTNLYVDDIKSGYCCPLATPSVIKEGPATAVLDGNNGLGPVVGKHAMELAIKKAKDIGVSWVVVKGSNHYGIAGYYTKMAVKEGMIGFSVTNTSPCVVPMRGKRSIVGTNPLSVAAPAKNGDSFVLDMATSAVSVGKIEVQYLKGETISESWAFDKHGNETVSPKDALEAAALMPLGSKEINSGYKGYGLALMVEVFSGMLAGSAYGPYIRHWLFPDKYADIGHCFAAINPSYFTAGFEDRLSDLMNICRKETPRDSGKPVLVPGDPERQHRQKVDEEEGIWFHINQFQLSQKLGEKMGVKPMVTIK